MKPHVHRDKFMSYSLWGPTHWWVVTIGMEPVAKFVYWQDAVAVARIYASRLAEIPGTVAAGSGSTDL